MRTEIFCIVVLAQSHIVSGVNQFDLNYNRLHPNILKSQNQRLRCFWLLRSLAGGQSTARLMKTLLSIAIRLIWVTNFCQSPLVHYAFVSDFSRPICVLTGEYNSIGHFIFPKDHRICYGWSLVALSQVMSNLFKVVIHFPLLESWSNKLSCRWKNIFLPEEK